jgi:hypothetical protein
MQINDILAETGGLQSMARELGISEAQVASGAAALGPAILGGFKKQVQSQPDGLAGLGGLLGQLGGGGLLDGVLGQQPTDLSQGNGVLGQIFGSKDVSRTVSQDAAAKTGLDLGILKKMLPMLAMVVAGYMARRHANAGAAPASAQGGGRGDLLGALPGGGRSGASAAGIGSMLDTNGDGNALDDILRMAGKAMN